jgi:2'-5' RNA ligase
MTELWRCFVAVPIGDRLRSDLGEAVASWHEDSRLAGVRWTDPDAWHVTLAFLGPTDPRRIASIADAIQSVAADALSTSLPTGGIGAFPSGSRTRVLWYRIADPDAVLSGISARLHQALRLEPPLTDRPHLTLGRARRKPLNLRGVIDNLSAPTGTLGVEEIRLMRSHRGSGPAHYQTLAAVSLGGSVRV